MSVLNEKTEKNVRNVSILSFTKNCLGTSKIFGSRVIAPAPTLSSHATPVVYQRSDYYRRSLDHNQRMKDNSSAEVEFL